jgi:ATP-dependent Zn protease
MEQEYTFVLTSGRRDWVDEFHFERTYAGLMAGYPKNEPDCVTKQEKKAEAMWGAGATLTVRLLGLDSS